MSRRTGRTRSLPGTFQTGIDVGALTILLGLGVLGFGPTFGGDLRYLAAGFGGIAIGLLTAWLSTRQRWGFWTTAGILFGAYLLLGHALAAPVESFLGFLPTLESLRVLIVGIVFSWKDLLTVADPVGISRGMLVVPFLSALLFSVAAGLLAWRVRTPYWVLLPVFGLFVASIAFGTNRASLPELRGVLLVVALTAWLAYRRDIARTDRSGALSANAALPPDGSASAASGGLQSNTARRVGLGGAVLAVGTVLTLLINPVLAGGTDRDVLRDVVEPPVDLFDYPSPLTSFRKYVKDQTDETLLTVAGLPEGQRIRLAAMDAYDGVVYNVNPQAAGNFARVGDAQQLGSADLAEDEGTVATLDITVGAYNGVWLPSGGELLGVDLGGPRSQDLNRSLYYNDDARTALSTIGVQSGDTYSVNVVFPDIPSDEVLTQYDFADLTLPRVRNEPPVIASKASEYVGEVSDPIERVRRLEQVLSSQGFFSNGKDGEAPSLPGHGAARMLTLLDAEQMVGDDEQYAVAMALMARKLNIPARVVMGFYPDWDEVEDPSAPIALTGEDVHAWVEVAFDNAGWVPLNPTPPEDNEPVPPQQQPRSSPKPQVLQPPPPPQEPAELPPDSAPEPQDAEDRQKDFWDDWGPLIRAIALALIPLGVLLLPLLLILLLKVRRRKRRANDGAPSQRVGGGWSEVLSLATDLGADTNAKATRRESARELGQAFPASAGSTTLLAERADASIFAAGEPTEQEVGEYWNAVETSLEDMRGSVGWFRRQRAKFSPRSLIRETRSRMAPAPRRGTVRRPEQ
ncbi:Transglutaminase-like superfamily protein [Arthrobacter subterraneus]|uniref:Transglutaminase-like superfamily protein n=1 Tax=Arthrobacter subterraneus TaxID=335973 RepID=A0A1G8GM05_9MICC|nr:transglutaminase-like domain-containing protein [Arthrobacter subterraneus]SDH95346.1 Transglutaminase-like superfamily protein [Arthrobacter subterraneus]